MTNLQKKILELLKDVDQLCREHNIEYYLTAGALLGAMRHKGFIPWDDDADIIMTRNNWEKFLNCTKGNLPENIRINTQCENANLAMTANHYTDINSTEIYRYDLSNPEETGIMIDVIIMDPVPGDTDARQNYVDALTTHTELTALCYQYSLRIGKSTNFSKYWRMSRVRGKKDTLAKIDETAFSYDDEDAAFYVQRFAGSPHFWPKEWFGTPKYVPFEDIMLPVPERAADCLCVGFDDEWMYVPEESTLVTTHEYCVRNMNVPVSVIMGDFKHLMDHKSMVKTYVKKKKIQVRNTKNKFYQELGKEKFVEAKLQIIYAHKREKENFLDYLNQENCEALESYFEEYMCTQCTSRFLGSSSLTGWINWYRKCHPTLIDIGDNELYAVLGILFRQQRLRWIGQLLKARSSMERPLPNELKSMDELYHAIRTAKSHFFCEEWDKCQEIVDEYFLKYPTNPFLYKLNLELKLKTGASVCDLSDEIDSGLELFPNDSELLLLKAEKYFVINQTDKALLLYQKLIDTTRDGLVLLHMKEKMKIMIQQTPTNPFFNNLWLKIRERSGEEVTREEEKVQLKKESISKYKNEFSELDNVQKTRLQLLIELAQICDKYKIEYFLIDTALWQAAITGKYIDPNADLTVAMTPDNCKKFINAIDSEGNADRSIDAMYTNPYFHRFALHYYDKNTLDMAVSKSGYGNQYGIFVTIEILRNPSKRKFTDGFYRMLESGWESTIQGKWDSHRQQFSKAFVNFLCIVLLGRKRAAKLIFNVLLNGSKKREGGKMYIKPFLKKRKSYPAYFFQSSKKICFEGHEFNTMKLFDLYLNSQYGISWRDGFPIKNELLINRVVSAEVSVDEYLNYLDKHKIDRNAYWLNYRKMDARYSRVDRFNKSIQFYWDVMSACGERYRLYEKYMPIKSKIMKLYREENIGELQRLLDDYIDTAITYENKKQNIYFDQQLFEVLKYVLIRTERVKEANLLQDIKQKNPVPSIDMSSKERESA